MNPFHHDNRVKVVAAMIDAMTLAPSQPLRIWFDTEFHDDGTRVELISLGAVFSDGREYYAENALYDRGRASPWLQAHVLSQLTPGSERMPAQIAGDLREMVGSAIPEFWAYFGEYDWIVLRQLFGDLMQWPAGWPLSHMNLEQWRLHLGTPAMSIQANDLHNAMQDARWVHLAWQHLMEYDRRRNPTSGVLRPSFTDSSVV